MTAKPLIELDAAIAALSGLSENTDRRYCENSLRALPTVTAEPLGAEWMRRKAMTEIAALWQWDDDGFCVGRPNTATAISAILAIPAPTDDDLDRFALARPKVAKLVEALEAIMRDIRTGYAAVNLNVINRVDAALAALPKEGE